MYRAQESIKGFSFFFIASDKGLKRLFHLPKHQDDVRLEGGFRTIYSLCWYLSADGCSVIDGVGLGVKESNSLVKLHFIVETIVG